MGTINFETSRDPRRFVSLARTKPESGATIGTFSLRKLETIPSFHTFPSLFFFIFLFSSRPFFKTNDEEAEEFVAGS